MTLADLRAETRRLIGHPKVDTVPNHMLDSLLQGALDAYNRRVGYTYTDDTSITTVDGTQEYTLPSDVVEILWVEYGTALLDRTDQDELRRRGIDWRDATKGTPTEYYHYGGKIGFYVKPDAATAVRIRYIATPASIPTNGPSIPTQDHRLLTYHAAATWLAAHPGQGNPGSSESLFGLFEREMAGVEAQYARRKVGPRP